MVSKPLFMLLTSWLASPSVEVDAFAPARQTRANVSIGPRKSLSERHNPILLHLSSNNEEEDPLMNDQREGMADAFAALDGLTADDFDSYVPQVEASGTSQLSMEELQSLEAELAARGQEGMYGDILGDLTGGNNNSPVFNDADGLGATSFPSEGEFVTTADVSNDILTQDIQPSLSMEEFMSSAVQEAVEEIATAGELTSPSASDTTGRTEDIAKTAEELLENEELRREIEAIFDKAGEKLRLEVEAMKREQERVTQTAARQGDEYLELEKQRLSEAEESVTRLIQKVARETDEVQKAMADLELARSQASGEGSGSIEDTALDLKKGGIVKQASLVGALLFGSRAVTETILVVGSPYGDQHFVPAAVQAAIALACAAYFFFVK